MLARRIVVPLLVFALVQVLSRLPATWADELLQDGGFEQTPSPWALFNATFDGCDAHSGSTAIRLTSPGGDLATVQQEVSGLLAQGAYRLSGWLKVAEGSPQVKVNFTWLDGNDAAILQRSDNLTATAGYSQFLIQVDFAQDNATRMRIRFTSTSASASSVCLDDVSLDGPSLLTPTATPTATPSPTNSPGPTPTPTPTRKPSATSTSVVSQSFSFINGGFEEGTRGWQKYGGELSVADSPRLSGQAAGLLESRTTSTKWAYQTVAIDSGQFYEFSGSLLPQGDVSGAFLRISWYATADGSGEALSTADSSESASGGAGKFTSLTTGPVQAPSGAQTAKLRVMLTPSSAAPARLYMDDFIFAAVAPPTSTPEPSATTAPTATSSPSSRTPTAAPTAPSAASTDRRAAAEAPSETALPGTPALTSTPLVSEVSEKAVAAPTSEPKSHENKAQSESSDGVPLPALAGAGLFTVALAGAYLHGKRRRS